MMTDSPQWLTKQTAADTVHAVPLDDGIVHDFTPGCPCGPAPQAVPGGVVLVHASLDGREHQETP
ncbi:MULTISPECIES: hypothetical protein [Streptomyces]|uniref:hypothetical protein n=1 Tax=Streptomyces TaxID=1883 RepID=UPI00103DFF43|nr:MULTISPECIES: hypothetical protein [Streptomyces]MBT3077656.1 hypothetical protein [Streptomyces sp. COG21]MBT3084502.1 hypothetical protein [Streptomyces sp. COG20]MBT3085408.1 hypothetical protein [Streptomyces sp. CYG21]MBT3099002.1 hypothetical protein [Streptomyces sp. CBG30]MBT3103549.1 hypothetical protein [Streptomyces sp. COG19]